MSDVTPKTPSTYWPSIESREDAIKVMHYAFFFAVFQIILTVGLALYSTYKGETIDGINAYSLVDAAIVALIAWRLYRLSFGWAIAAVIYTSINVGVSRYEGRTKAPIIGIIVLLAYVNAVRAGHYLRKHPESLAPQITA